MKILKTKERGTYSVIDIETDGGEVISLEVYANHNIIRVNSAFANLSIKPRTSNELDLVFEDK